MTALFSRVSNFKSKRPILRILRKHFARRMSILGEQNIYTGLYYKTDMILG